MERTGPPVDGGLESRIEALETRLAELERATTSETPSSLVSRMRTLEDALRSLRRQAVAATTPAAAPRGIDATAPAAPSPAPTPAPAAAAIAAAAVTAPTVAGDSWRCQERDGLDRRCVHRATHGGAHSAAHLAQEWAPVATGARPAEAPAEPTEVAPAPWAPPAPNPLVAAVRARIPEVDSREALGRFIQENTGRALAWVGGTAVVVAAVVFLGWGIQTGLITEPWRVLIGLVAGSAALALGAWFIEQRNALLGHVLTPVGLAVIMIALVAGTRLYDLFPVPVGLAVALFAAALTALIAVRADSQLIAAFGLVSVLAAPPLLGASADLVTLAFVGAALVGTTAIALWRTWSWLPPVAFLLAAPQAADWLMGETNTTFGLAGLAAFWALNAVAAGGEEFRRRRTDLSPSSATLVLAAAAFLVWGGFVLLDGDLTAWRGSFLVAAAVANLALGAWFLVRDGDQSLFGLLVSGTGVAILTLAAPVGLGAPAVPVAWAAEAVALAWLASRRRHAYSAIVAAILYGLAAAYVVAVLFPFQARFDGVVFPGAALALVALDVGLLLGAVLVRDRSAWNVLATVGLLVTAWGVGMAAELEWAVVGLSALVVAGAALRRGLPQIPERRIAWTSGGRITVSADQETSLREIARGLLPSSLVAIGVAATILAAGASASSPADGRPFISAGGAALGVYLIALAAIAALERSWTLRQAIAALGTLVLAWACAWQLDGVSLVAAWTALAVAATAIWRGLGHLETLAGPAAAGPGAPTASAGRSGPTPVVRLVLPGATAMVGALAVVHVMLHELPFESFGRLYPPEIPFADIGSLAAAILAVGSIAIGLLVGGPTARRAGILGAGLAVAYLIPYQVFAWAVASLWSGLAVAAVVASRIDRSDPGAFRIASAGILVAAAAVAAGIVAPPSRLLLPEGGVSVSVAVESAVALAWVVIAGAVVAWNELAERWGRFLEVGVGVAFVYALSMLTVDAFATQVGGAIPTADLRSQAQLAMSVLWVVIGAVGFLVGLWRERDDLRLGGLALLALAAVKVFVFDTASLEGIYRAGSFFFLGLALLGLAWLWQHFRPGGRAHGPHAPGRPAH
jgi:hypothetical protein